MDAKITKQQYLDALKVIKQYQTEQLIENESLLRLLEEEGASSTLIDRITDLLQEGITYRGLPFTFIYDISALYFVSHYNRRDLLMRRNLGAKKADEFEKILELRGYRFGMNKMSRGF